MKLREVSPKVATKELLKLRPLRSDIDSFKSNLLNLLNKVDIIEREENQKTHVRDFLVNTFYKGTNEINTKNATDLVIHLGNSNKDKVGVIIEAKRPNNKSEMITLAKPNAKAFHELVLYYMRERIDENNVDIKNCIATNIYEWFIFDAQYFEKFFAKDKGFVNDYKEWRDGKKVTRDTNLFYNEIVKPYVDKIQEEIPVTQFDIRDYDKALRNADKKADKSLIALYKAQSPYHLLRKSAADSNSLDDKFYKELLYIIGLEEVKDNGKNLISRKLDNRNSGSLIENVISFLETEDLYKVKSLSQYGPTKEERIFSIALELSLTWINRILFLKLLEGQLIDYHRGSQEYRFLNIETVHDFDELYKLFHQVLARTYDDRSVNVKEKYKHVPYLNSSLFEISELEDQTIRINSLDNMATLALMPNSVLSDKNKRNQVLPTLEYLFRFLDSYDFASEGKDDIQEDNKTLINASVLGKVFEKINGYKDGSIYTPGFITMYMCREAIRKSVLQRFNDQYNWECETFNSLYNKITDRVEANNIINSLKIGDLAVGSGHFLVSALNEIIAIKAELGILQDKNGKRIKDYNIEVINDELVMIDEYGDPFIYNANNHESQRIQKTLFEEKQTIIENCLFGVDINSNSVKICRLRLWIELLKNAYYKEETGFKELETLPNIDINIKTGNSLISRYSLTSDLKKALKNINHTIQEYKDAVNKFKNATHREEKRQLFTLINDIKSDFQTYFSIHDDRREKLSKARGELIKLQSDTLFDTKKANADNKKKTESLLKKIKTIENEIEAIKTNLIYQNAFEWRFEFPEILDNDGDFAGFDIIIGNPPYIQLQKLGEYADILQQLDYKTFARTGDIYALFYEQGLRLLKENGILAYITSNKWMRAAYGESLRNYFLVESNPLQLIDFAGLQLFDSATVDTNILLTQNANNKNELRTCVLDKNFESLKNLSDYFRHYSNVSTGFVTNSNWIILSSLEQKIKEKIEQKSIPLRDWGVNIYRGILTGYNDAFIINPETRDKLIKSSSNSAEIIRPILRGRDIEKYVAKWNELYLITTFPSLQIDIDNFETIKNYLLSFGIERLEQTGMSHIVNGVKIISRKKTTNKWFETQDTIGYWKDFQQSKIIWKRIGSVLRFAYDDTGMLCLDSTCFAVGSDMKYLTGVLNSIILRKQLLANSPKTGTGDVITSVQALEPLLIPIVTESEKYKIEQLVDKAINIKLTNSLNDTSDVETEIDNILFNLYGFSEEEKRYFINLD
ncbi:MAG TPA: Eco57I restriction-modification methylase domain-containing protein [Flavipsychrobacter sp.]|nr:Eco57I restriction-modification methylase domain-containing protein [Flavipsychrobacter sp.]